MKNRKTVTALRLLTASTALTIISSSALASAAMTGNLGFVRPMSDWQVGKVASADESVPSYCASVNNFEKGFTLALAKSKSGSYSLALDFPHSNFMAGEEQAVSLQHSDGYHLQTTAKAVNSRSLIMQLGQEELMFAAMSNEGHLGISLPGLELKVSLATFSRSAQKLADCVAALDVVPVEVEEVRAVPPLLPIEKQSGQDGMDAVSAQYEAAIVMEQAALAEKLEPLPPAPSVQLIALADSLNDVVPQAGDDTDKASESEIEARAEIKADPAERSAAELAKVKVFQEMGRRNMAKTLEKAPEKMPVAAPEIEAPKITAIEPTPLTPTSEDQLRRSRIEALSGVTGVVEEVPIAVIQDELMMQQADLERQARAQAVEAEWLERRRSRIENADLPKEIESGLAMEKKLDELKAENQKLEQAHLEAMAKLAEIEKSNTQLLLAKKSLEKNKLESEKLNAAQQSLEAKMKSQTEQLDALAESLEAKQDKIEKLQAYLTERQKGERERLERVALKASAYTRARVADKLMQAGQVRAENGSVEDARLNVLAEALENKTTEVERLQKQLAEARRANPVAPIAPEAQPVAAPVAPVVTAPVAVIPVVSDAQNAAGQLMRQYEPHAGGNAAIAEHIRPLSLSISSYSVQYSKPLFANALKEDKVENFVEDRPVALAAALQAPPMPQAAAYQDAGLKMASPLVVAPALRKASADIHDRIGSALERSGLQDVVFQAPVEQAGVGMQRLWTGKSGKSSISGTFVRYDDLSPENFASHARGFLQAFVEGQCRNPQQAQKSLSPISDKIFDARISCQDAGGEAKAVSMIFFLDGQERFTVLQHQTDVDAGSALETINGTLIQFISSATDKANTQHTQNQAEVDFDGMFTDRSLSGSEI